MMRVAHLLVGGEGAGLLEELIDERGLGRGRRAR